MAASGHRKPLMQVVRYRFHGWNLRKPRRRQKSAPKPPKFVRVIGRHGALHIIEVIHRGKRTLRYTPFVPESSAVRETATHITSPN